LAGSLTASLASLRASRTSLGGSAGSVEELAGSLRDWWKPALSYNARMRRLPKLLGVPLLFLLGTFCTSMPQQPRLEPFTEPSFADRLKWPALRHYNSNAMGIKASDLLQRANIPAFAYGSRVFVILVPTVHKARAERLLKKHGL